MFNMHKTASFEACEPCCSCMWIPSGGLALVCLSHDFWESASFIGFSIPLLILRFSHKNISLHARSLQHLLLFWSVLLSFPSESLLSSPSASPCLGWIPPLLQWQGNWSASSVHSWDYFSLELSVCRIRIKYNFKIPLFFSVTFTYLNFRGCCFLYL